MLMSFYEQGGGNNNVCRSKSTTERSQMGLIVCSLLPKRTHFGLVFCVLVGDMGCGAQSEASIRQRRKIHCFCLTVAITKGIFKEWMDEGMTDASDWP